MTMAEHRAVVMGALAAGRQMDALFADLGTQEHPRGRVLSAYRTTQRALREVFRRGGQAWEALEVLRGLREQVAAVATAALARAAEIGRTAAGDALEAYGLSVPVGQQSMDQALQAWLAVLEAQLAQARAVIQVGGDPTLIVGDETRGGMLQPGPVVREGARWVAIVAGMAWLGITGDALQRRLDRDQFLRQAIAAIDERTTDCCLRVHGQVVQLEEDFRLTGEPRYADRLRDPPFHWWCRTSVALVRAEDAQDELTGEMRRRADEELAARAEAQRHIDELKAELTRLGAAPDVRIRKSDTAEIRRLRNELRMWRARLRVEIHPSHGRSKR
jgi:hypothetical protein